MNGAQHTPGPVVAVPPRVDFDFSAVGLMRSTGEVIALLLMAEDPDGRAEILMDVAKGLGISLQDLSDEYTGAVHEKRDAAIAKATGSAA